MLETKDLANRVAKKFGTRDPYEIAKAMGITVMTMPLGKTRGFMNSVGRLFFININADVDEQQQRIVCAHELGHYFMHRNLNRIFMDTRTFMKTAPLENEAHRFAVDLLFDDSDLQPYLEYNSETVARCLGVNRQLAEYRMSTVVPMLW